MSRILAVDDDLDARESLQAVLELSGYEVETAGDGEAAIEILGHSSFAAMILDMMMPRLDGYGVLRELKRRPHLRPSCIIVCAGNFFPDRLKNAMQPHHVITKPADPGQLLDLLRRCA